MTSTTQINYHATVSVGEVSNAFLLEMLDGLKKRKDKLTVDMRVVEDEIKRRGL